MLKFLLLLCCSLYLSCAYTQPETLHIYNNCELQENLIDEFYKKQKRALKARWFFSFTPKSYKKFFNGEDYLRCEGFLVEIDKKYSLHLRIIVQDKTAKKTFGDIPANSKIFIYPIRGSVVSLQSIQAAKITEEQHQTTYECRFPISKRQSRALKKLEIDRIRINWSEGFQTYNVYYLDFLSDQFFCLDKK